MANRPNGRGQGGDPSPNDPPNEEFNYDEWFAALPEKAKTRFQQDVFKQAYDQYNAQLNEEYGDFMPVVTRLKDNPEKRKRFVEAFGDDETANFLLEDAYTAFKGATKPSEPSATQALEDKEARAALKKVEEKIDNQELQGKRLAYEASRQKEFTALANEFEDLRFAKTDKSDPAYKRAMFLIEMAEKRSLDTGKAVPYREVYEEMQDIYGNAMPVAPSTTLDNDPPQRTPQAPRTQSEGRERALATLRKHGGFMALAKAGRR